MNNLENYFSSDLLSLERLIGYFDTERKLVSFQIFLLLFSSFPDTLKRIIRTCISASNVLITRVFRYLLYLDPSYRVLIGFLSMPTPNHKGVKA